jgi:predicted secreted Zn-dependent protease
MMSDRCLKRRFGRLDGAFLLLLAGFAAMLVGAGGALARPHSHTTVKYYTVTGPDDRSLDAQMARFGPMHHGGHAYATLSADPTFKGRLVPGRYCRLQQFRVDVGFVMTLPRLSSRAHLSAATRSRWNRFAAFVRHHEERHRTIWLGCLARGEVRAVKLRIGDCDRLDQAVAEVFREEWARCEKLQDAFDAAQHVLLKRQPLIIAAGKLSHQAALTHEHSAAAVRINFRGGTQVR